jgi:hypothetical protein
MVPLLIEQEASARVSAWVELDDRLVVWTFTPVEIVSALHRLVRENALDDDLAQSAEARLDRSQTSDRDQAGAAGDLEGYRRLRPRA